MAGFGKCSKERSDSAWVSAAGKGVVRYAGNSLVEIDHGGGFRTGYYHLRTDDIQVSVNQEVEAGTKLGHPACYEAKLGGDASKGVHVHFYTCLQPDESSFCGPYARNGLAIDGIGLSAWLVVKGMDAYDGTMTKDGQATRRASIYECGPDSKSSACKVDGNAIRNDLTVKR
jgi:hypothetical protein